MLRTFAWSPLILRQPFHSHADRHLVIGPAPLSNHNVVHKKSIIPAVNNKRPAMI